MSPSPPPVSPPHPLGCPLAALARGGGHPARLQPCTLRGRLKNPPFGLRSRNSPSKMLSSFHVRVSLPAVLAEAASSPPEIPKNPQIAALRRKTADVRRTPRARGAAPHPRGALSRHNPPSGGGLTSSLHSPQTPGLWFLGVPRGAGFPGFRCHVRGSPGTRLRFPLPLSALPTAPPSSPPALSPVGGKLLVLGEPPVARELLRCYPHGSEGSEAFGHLLTLTKPWQRSGVTRRGSPSLLPPPRAQTPHFDPNFRLWVHPRRCGGAALRSPSPGRAEPPQLSVCHITSPRA